MKKLSLMVLRKAVKHLGLVALTDREVEGILIVESGYIIIPKFMSERNGDYN